MSLSIRGNISSKELKIMYEKLFFPRNYKFSMRKEDLELSKRKYFLQGIISVCFLRKLGKVNENSNKCVLLNFRVWKI